MTKQFCGRKHIWSIIRMFADCSSAYCSLISWCRCQKWQCMHVRLFHYLDRLKDISSLNWSQLVLEMLFKNMDVASFVVCQRKKNKMKVDEYIHTYTSVLNVSFFNTWFHRRVRILSSKYFVFVELDISFGTYHAIPHNIIS